MRAVLVLLLAFITLSCSGPKDTVIPTDMTKWESELKPSIEKLKEDERVLFADYVVRAKMSEAFGAKLLTEGMTIGKAIEEQKKWIAEREKKAAEQKAIQEQAQKKREAVRKQVEDFLKVEVLSVKVIKANVYAGQFMDQLSCTLEFKNTGSKDITGIKGAVLFIDIFDKQVGAVSFSYDDGVKAGSSAKWNGTRNYNDYIPEDRAMAHLEAGKYKTVFEPEMIVYEDGTKLTLE